MKFSGKLTHAVIVSRYKRLVIDIRLDNGKIVPAYCPDFNVEYCNYAEGADVWVSCNYNVNKKLKYNIEIVDNGNGLIYIDQTYGKDLIIEAYKEGIIEELKDYNSYEILENNYNCNIEIEFSKDNGEKFYIASSFALAKRSYQAVFPANVSFAELKLLDKIEKKVKDGNRGAVFLIVPRLDCTGVRFIWDLKPHSAAAIYKNAKSGVEFICYGCNIDTESVEIKNKLEIDFKYY
jgi:sugar fermentation stimulation protein A